MFLKKINYSLKSNLKFLFTMKSYYHLGDSGKSSILSGNQILKNSPIFEALGSID